MCAEARPLYKRGIDKRWRVKASEQCFPTAYYGLTHTRLNCTQCVCVLECVCTRNATQLNANAYKRNSPKIHTIHKAHIQSSTYTSFRRTHNTYLHTYTQWIGNGVYTNERIFVCMSAWNARERHRCRSGNVHEYWVSERARATTIAASSHRNITHREQERQQSKQLENCFIFSLRVSFRKSVLSHLCLIANAYIFRSSILLFVCLGTSWKHKIRLYVLFSIRFYKTNSKAKEIFERTFTSDKLKFGSHSHRTINQVIFR